MPSPKEISQKKFEKAFGFGYRMDDVEEYLELVAKEMQGLLEEKESLEKKLEVLADKLTEYRDDEESLRTAILSAQKLGDSLIRESKTKAEIIMRDATVKADAMVSNARRQIERENDTLIRIQKEVALFKNRLIELYKQHLELITSLPGDDDEPKKQPAPKKAAPAREEVKEEAPAPAEETEEPSQEATIEFAPASEEKEVAASETSLTEDEEKALMGDEEEIQENQEDTMFKEQRDNGSLKKNFDEEEEDDELDLSFFNKASSDSHENKKKEMRFGESYKIKRDSGYPRF